MLSTIRTFAKSWVATVVLGLVMVSFLFVGVQGKLPSHLMAGDAVVTAGSRQVQGPEFKRRFMRELQQLEQQQQQSEPITIQQAVAAGFDGRVLNDVATDEAYAEYTKRLGVTAAPSMIGDAISKETAFFNRLTGKFDHQAYVDILSKNQLTPPVYEAFLHDTLAQHQMDTGLVAGLQAPKTYSAMISALELETRDLSFFVLSPQNVNPPAPPTDAQLADFLKKNGRMRPEMRQLTVVRFSTQALTASMPVDQAQLLKLYNFRKDTASTPEQRTLVEIPVKDAATAAAVAAKLRAGQDPVAVAASIGAQPISYADTAQGAIADPKIGAAAFSMKAGEVSGPIQGTLGLGVVKVTAIKPSHTPTLDEMRPQLEQQVRADAATQKVYDMVQKYEHAHGGGTNLADAAKASGQTPQAIGPVTAQGVDIKNAPVQGLSPKLLADAFKLPQGGESDIETDSKGEYFAVRVDKVIAPAMPTLAEVKPDLIKAYTFNTLQTELTTEASELSARVRKGESMQAVAASVGATVSQAKGLSRFKLSQNQSMPPQLAEQVFGSKIGDVFTAPTGQIQVMVAHVDSGGPAAAADIAAMAVQYQGAATNQLQEDMAVQLRTVAKAKIKPVTNPDLARQALGVSADSAGKSSGQPAGTPAS